MIFCNEKSLKELTFKHCNLSNISFVTKAVLCENLLGICYTGKCFLQLVLFSMIIYYDYQLSKAQLSLITRF